MKTKHILTAIALPALLAACSQDAELSEALNQKDYSNIPTVDVDFNATIGAETRMATKFGWEVGDKIGLAWLGDGTTISTNTNGLAYQNHPLFCTDATKAAFKTETMLYIGNYFAYMPYNPGKMTVENIEFTTKGQTLSTNANDLAKKAIYISPKKVKLSNADKTPAGEEPAGMGNNIQLNLSRLSNAATLDLTFKNAAALADLKVMGVSIDVQTDPGAVSVLPVSFQYNPQDNASLADWSSLAADAVRTFFTSTAGGSLSAVATVGAISVTSETGIALSADGKLKTYALILPATVDIASGHNLVITISTNYGNIVATNVKVGGGDWNTSALFTKFGQSATITADVDAEDMVFPNKTVKTQTELNSVLAAAAAAGYEDPIEITINPATQIANGAAFDLKDFTMPAGLKSAITLVAGANANAKLNFTGTSTIDKQLTIKTGTTATVSGILNVKNVANGNTQLAALTVTDGITINNGGGVLNNEGKIDADVTTSALSTSPAKAAGLYVSAGEKACLASGKTFTNSGAIKWTAGEVPTGTTGLVYAEVNNFNDLRAAAVATSCVTTARFMKEVTFNNANTNITIGQIATIEVNAPVTININANTINEAQKIDFSALTKLNINEGGKLTIVSDNKKNELSAAANCVTTLATNSELSLKLLTITNFEDLTYAGKVTLEDVLPSPAFTGTQTKNEGGSMSIINN
jgi:hypothetical protein